MLLALPRPQLTTCSHIRCSRSCDVSICSNHGSLRERIKRATSGLVQFWFSYCHKAQCTVSFACSYSVCDSHRPVVKGVTPSNQHDCAFRAQTHSFLCLIVHSNLRSYGLSGFGRMWTDTLLDKRIYCLSRQSLRDPVCILARFIPIHRTHRGTLHHNGCQHHPSSTSALPFLHYRTWPKFGPD